MASLMWFKNLHKIVQRQCNSHIQIQTAVRFLPSFRGKRRVKYDSDVSDSDEPYYALTDKDPPVDRSLITIPTRLRRRLEKKNEKDSTKYGQRIKLLEQSRQGSKGQLMIKSRRPELNHYKGQTYGAKAEVLPLISKGWRHKGSHGDWFTIQPHKEDTAFTEIEDQETFESLGLNNRICSILEQARLMKPTVIQAVAIPQILNKQHNLLAAETGCGKTYAYLLPIFHQIMYNKSMRHKRKANQPYAVIVVPTRELAEQVAKVAIGMGQALGIYVRLLQSGNIQGQINNPSSKEYDIVVTTIYILSTLSVVDVIDLSKVVHVVLDEADTMLDDSFAEEVLRFLSRFHFAEGAHNVQATLVSATMPKKVEETLGEVIPVDSMNKITTPGLHRVAKAVPQKFMRVRKMDKPDIIVELAQKAKDTKSPTIIFTNKAETCHWLKGHLIRNGIDCVAVHGKIYPGERRGLMRQYVSGEVDVLVTTDVGSRGIDAIRTKHVVNYEFPRYLADYVHRCGRVGRVGSGPGGLVTNLVSSGFEVETIEQIEVAVRREESLRRVDANIKRLLNSRYGMYKTINPITAEDEEEKDE